MKIDPRLVPYFTMKYFATPSNPARTVQGTFHTVSGPVPIGKLWLLSHIQMEGRDSSAAFAAVGQTDGVLTGIWLAPPNVKESFIPDGWFSSTRGYPPLQGCINLTDSIQEDGFNGALGGGGVMVKREFSDELIIVPENWQLIAVWAVFAGGSYPTVNASILMSLFMAEIDRKTLCGC